MSFRYRARIEAIHSKNNAAEYITGYRPCAIRSAHPVVLEGTGFGYGLLRINGELE